MGQHCGAASFNAAWDTGWKHPFKAVIQLLLSAIGKAMEESSSSWAGPYYPCGRPGWNF